LLSEPNLGKRSALTAQCPDARNNGHLLATGRFLAMLPVAMARLAKHLPVKRLDVRFPGIPRSVAVMTLKNRTLSPLARLFIERAHEMAKPLAGLQ
jgi:DNA-binding transcriptional LysR family regulator